MKKMLILFGMILSLFTAQSCVIEEDTLYNNYNNQNLSTNQLANLLVGAWVEKSCVEFSIPCKETWDNYKFNNDGTFYFEYYGYDGKDNSGNPIYLSEGTASGKWMVYRNNLGDALIALDYITQSGTVQDDEFIIYLDGNNLEIENISTSGRKQFYK